MGGRRCPMAGPHSPPSQPALTKEQEPYIPQLAQVCGSRRDLQAQRGAAHGWQAHTRRMRLALPPSRYSPQTLASRRECPVPWGRGRRRAALQTSAPRASAYTWRAPARAPTRRAPAATAGSLAPAARRLSSTCSEPPSAVCTSLSVRPGPAGTRSEQWAAPPLHAWGAPGAPAAHLDARAQGPRLLRLWRAPATPLCMLVPHPGAFHENEQGGEGLQEGRQQRRQERTGRRRVGHLRDEIPAVTWSPQASTQNNEFCGTRGKARKGGGGGGGGSGLCGLHACSTGRAGLAA